MLTVYNSLGLEFTAESIYPETWHSKNPDVPISEFFQIKLVNETINNLKSESSKNTEAIRKKEINAYKDDLHALNTENMSLRNYVQDLVKKIEGLKQKKNALKKEVNLFKNKNTDSVYNSDRKIEEIKQEVLEKDRENEAIKETLHRSEHQKKILAENLKDLENENLKLRSELSKLESFNEALKMKIQNMSEIYALSEQKLRKHENLIEELNQNKILLQSVESKYNEEHESLECLKQTLESQKFSFELQKNHWYKKEIAYQASIQELLERLNNEKVLKEIKVAETIKLKKALTQKDSDETLSNLTREEIIRYQHRLSTLETEVINKELEIEKLSKNQEYYRGLINNKNEIISQLEVKIETIHKEQKTQKIVEGFEKRTINSAIFYLQSSMSCQKCDAEKIQIIMNPCGHVICENCNETGICSICKISCSSSPFAYLETIEKLITQLQGLI